MNEKRTERGETAKNTPSGSAQEKTEEEIFSRDPNQTTPLMDSPDAPPPDQIRFGVTAKDGFEGHNRPADGDDMPSTASAGVDPGQTDEPASGAK